jgi:hypothetical protein
MSGATSEDLEQAAAQEIDNAVLEPASLPERNMPSAAQQSGER